MDAKDITQKFNLSPIVAELLLARNFDTQEKISEFIELQPLSSPYLLPNMKEGVQRIKDAINNKESIVIFGDYDCDGIGAVAILYKSLKRLNAVVNYFIPLRKQDGYGIKWESLSRAHQQFKPSLIISVDCGISSFAEIARAKTELGVDFVITDHHDLPENLPDAILINPHLNDSSELCGAGVAFKLSCALIGEEAACEYIDICAISTIADLVPLLGENRTIVRRGLTKLNKRNTCEGLAALIRLSGIKFSDEIKVYDVAFRLAPRLNSSGRLDSAEMSLKLLISEDSTEIEYLATTLDNNNKARQDLCAAIFADAMEKLKNYNIADNRLIVLEDDSWDSGVIGIVASKLVEKFCCPVILFTLQNGFFVGSSRSIKGIDMFGMLTQAKDLLIGYGGHEMAAGLQIRKENIPKLIDACREYIATKGCLIKEKEDTVTINKEELSLKLLHELALLEPYGMGNPQPIFLLDEKIEYQRIGSTNHIKAKLNSVSELVAFRCGNNIDFYNAYIKNQYIKVDKNLYKNTEKLSCVLQKRGEYVDRLSDESIQSSLLANYPYRLTKVRKVAERKYNGRGRLYVTFDANNYLKLKQDNSVSKHYICLQDDFSPENTVVLAPSVDFEYSYFNSVVFVDYVPVGLKDYLEKTFNGELIFSDLQIKIKSESFSLEALRAVFSVLHKNCNGIVFLSDKELYDKYFSSFIDLFSFKIAFNILFELNCVTINTENIMAVHWEKVQLNNSCIWRLVTCDK